MEMEIIKKKEEQKRKLKIEIENLRKISAEKHKELKEKYEVRITYLSGEVKKLDYQIHDLYKDYLRNEGFHTNNLEDLVVKLYREVKELKEWQKILGGWK